MGKIPVEFLFEQLNLMLNDHWGYIFGTAGVRWTTEKQADLINKHSRDSRYKTSVQYGGKWVGHMVTDCSGVMVYIWKQKGLSIPHGVNLMIRGGHVRNLSGNPKPGYAAIKKRLSNGSYSHIGIVGADGKTVYEAKGTLAGFTTSDVSTWGYFGAFKDVDYSEEVTPMETPFYGEVTGNKVRIRSGPGTDNPIIGYVNKGDIIHVEGIFDDWYFGKVVDSTLMGYISASYVTPTDYTPPEPVSETVALTIPRESAEMLYEALKGALGK